jgi:hypothetical protein
MFELSRVRRPQEVARLLERRVRPAGAHQNQDFSKNCLNVNHHSINKRHIIHLEAGGFLVLRLIVDSREGFHFLDSIHLSVKMRHFESY